jgi:hypothetical protein
MKPKRGSNFMKELKKNWQFYQRFFDFWRTMVYISRTG